MFQKHIKNILQGELDNKAEVNALIVAHEKRKQQLCM